MAEDLTPQQAASLAELIGTAAVAGATAELLPATLNVEANIRRRTFNEGQRANGQPIGSYSTKPFYLSIAGAKGKYGTQLPTSSLTARGKPGKGKKKGATAKKLFDEVVPLTSKYYGGGYAEFREDMNRQSGYVDLMLSGALAESLKTGLVKNESTIAFSTAEQAEKARGNEKRFTGEEGTIFAANTKDTDELLQALTEAATRAVDKLFRS